MQKNYVEVSGSVVFSKVYDGGKVPFQSVIIKISEVKGEKEFFTNVVCKAFGKVVQPKIRDLMLINVVGKIQVEKNHRDEYVTYVLVQSFKPYKEEATKELPF